jgi:hypothetical protein
MQRRLLNFFHATRALSDRVQWSFSLITKDNQDWPESSLVTVGLPPTWVTAIHVTAIYPHTDRFSSGFFTLYRIVRPRPVLRNIPRESSRLVADVLAEFSQRLPKSH